jgi:DNA repair protein RAD16
MSLTVTAKGVWRVAKGADQQWLYQVECAKTGRARCRKCSEYIAKDAIRVGIPIRHQAGEFGYIPAWQHMTCSRIDPVDDLDEKIYGLDDITLVQRVEVLAELQSTVLPPHLVELQPDDVIKRGPLEAMPAPPALLQHLLPFQEEGYGWMCAQEESEHRGGILADEMGMGKTIQTVAMIVKNRGVTPTLVVCPVSSMMQWQEEISTHVVPGELQVLTFHKARQYTLDELRAADVVLTTYPVLERMWRDLVTETKVACAYCNQLFVPKKLQVHNKYFCGPEAKRTQKLMKREKGVQSEATIKKGLKTLRVIDVDDDDDDDAEVAAESAAAASTMKKGKAKPAPKKAAAGKKAIKTTKRGRASSDDDDEDDDGDDESDDAPAKGKKGAGKKTTTVATMKSPAPKKALTAAQKKKAASDARKEKAAAAKQSKAAATAKAGKKKTSKKEETPPPAADEKRSIAGPMGMYRELMQDAGRRVRGRWEKAKEGATSDDDDDDDASTTSDDSDDSDGDDSTYADTSDADDSDDDDSSEEDEKPQRALPPSMCNKCRFPLSKHEFCPKDGAKHDEPVYKPMPTDDDDNVEGVVLSRSLLHSVKWFRVVLDEAHRIKGRTTSTARSAYALQAERRWCLTGTPVQNRVGDLYSLLRFMRMAPYARYYCGVKDCKCSTLSHPFSTSWNNWCQYCGHGPVQHFSHFNKHIMNPIQRYGYVGDGRKALMLLTDGVLNRVMLRRTKAERAADIKIPPCEITIVYIEQSAAERDFYESLYKRSTAKFDVFVNKGTLLHNYAHIFQLLSRLRQALDHPYLVLFSPTNATPMESAALLTKAKPSKKKAKKEDVKAEPTSDDDNVAATTAAAAVVGVAVPALPAAAVAPSDVCSLCQESTNAHTRFTVSPCKHGFHRACLRDFVAEAPEGKVMCPRCYVPMAIDLRKLNADDGDSSGEDDDSKGAAAKKNAKKPAAKKGGKKAAPAVLTAARPPQDDDDDDDDEDDVDDDDADVFQNVDDAGAAVKREAKDDADDAAATAAVPAKRPIASSIMRRIDTTKFVSGTKLDAVTKHVVSVTASGEDKVIVFSQFGSMLDLVEFSLERAKVRTVKLTGSMPLTARQNMLAAFRGDAAVRCILISLKAGGEGLNLQNANHVVLIDPWWNPAVDMQAVQRAHRIGQRKQVHAVRFVTKNTVEDRMLDLQKKKTLVFEGTVDGKVTSLQRLTEEDLQFLFQR